MMKMLGYLLTKGLAVNSLILQDLEEVFSILGLGVQPHQVLISQPQLIKPLGLRSSHSRLPQRSDEKFQSSKNSLLVNPRIHLLLGRTDW